MSPPAIAGTHVLRPATGPVAPAELVALELIGTGVGIGFGPQPAYPLHPPAASGLAPDASGRLFRARPRAGVTSPGVVALEVILPAAHTVALRAVCPVNPKPTMPVPSVLAIERIFRVRSKTGVPGAAESLPIALSLEAFAGRPAVVYAPVTECTPVQIHRMFRPRPRGPVDGQPAPMSSIGSNSLAVHR